MVFKLATGWLLAGYNSTRGCHAGGYKASHAQVAATWLLVCPAHGIPSGSLRLGGSKDMAAAPLLGRGGEE
jgi:hypothetical protein